MQRFTQFLLIMVCLAFTVQTGYAQRRSSKKKAAQTIEAGDVSITVEELSVDPVGYQQGEFPALGKVPSGKKLPYVMILVKYKWELTKDGLKKHGKGSLAADNSYYLDDLTLDWNVLLAMPAEGTGNVVKADEKGGFNIDPKISARMRKRISYVNVSSEGVHYAAIFLEGRSIRRYFDKRFKESSVFVDLSFKVGGGEVLRLNSHAKAFAVATQEEGDKGIKKREVYIPRLKRSLPPLLPSSESVRVLKGVLLSKDQTPWQFSKLATFEAIESSTSKSE